MSYKLIQKHPGTILAGFVLSLISVNSCHQKSELEIQKEVISQECIDENPAEELEKILPVEQKELKSDKRNIYLTFDDGPNRGTENLIKIVHKRKVPVTSFVVGQHIDGSKKQKDEFETMKSDTLIEIANHSYTHANNRYAKFYSDSSVVVEDFDRARDSLNISTGKIARTPGRNIWRTGNITATDLKSSTNAADELKNAGYTIIGWDLEWKPDKEMKLGVTHQEMIKKIDSVFYNDLEMTSRNLVFLTHDQYLKDENSVRELDLLIQKLQESNRFEFKKISEYPDLNKLVN